uniref:Cation-transporting P-type ATPase N-terminal domain-containing protein n=1 Tax=Octopus bimaculoides TaxID=37653 RepID=A0A0L8FW28_OCTBM
MDLAHAKTAEEACGFFGVDSNVGLTDDQIKKNLEKYGPNGLTFDIIVSGVCLSAIREKEILTDDETCIRQSVLEIRRQRMNRREVSAYLSGLTWNRGSLTWLFDLSSEDTSNNVLNDNAQRRDDFDSITSEQWYYLRRDGVWQTRDQLEIVPKSPSNHALQRGSRMESRHRTIVVSRFDDVFTVEIPLNFCH